MNMFPNDQENIWDVYGSPPPNVTLQSSLSMSTNLNLEDQINFQVPNVGSLRPNLYETSQFYSPETSPNNIQMYSPRSMLPNDARSRYQKQIFNYPEQQHLENGNERKPWNSDNVFDPMKNQSSGDKSPVISPHQNYQNMSQIHDVFGKGSVMDNTMIDPSAGQMFQMRYNDDSSKIQSSTVKNQNDVQQQLYQQQISQCQSLQQQLSLYSNKQLHIPIHHQQQQQQDYHQQKQQHQLLSHQQQNPQADQKQQQQQPDQKQQQQSPQHQMSPEHQKQIQQQPQTKQQQQFSTKQQRLQKDKNQKSNISTVFPSLSPKDSGKLSNNQPVDSRYEITLNALKQSGLLDITMQTGELLKKNTSLQKDIDMLEEIVKVTKHLMTNEGT